MRDTYLADAWDAVCALSRRRGKPRTLGADHHIHKICVGWKSGDMLVLEARDSDDSQLDADAAALQVRAWGGSRDTNVAPKEEDDE